MVLTLEYNVVAVVVLMMELRLLSDILVLLLGSIMSSENDVLMSFLMFYN